MASNFNFGASTGTAPVFGTGNNTGVYEDGDGWVTPLASGIARREFPFQNKGDAKTFIVRQKFTQAAASFTPLPLGTPHATYTTALLVEEGAHRDLGGGKIEWERVYATLPGLRTEAESFVYEFLLLLTDNSLSPVLMPVPSIVTYEYFRRGQEAQYPCLIAPKLAKAGVTIYKLGTGDLHNVGSLIVSNDPIIQAENDSYKDWMGDMRCRVRRTIAAPTVAFWGTNFTVVG